MTDADRTRSECYRRLSALFHAPERDTLLRDGAGVHLAEALQQIYPDTVAATHAAALHGALAEVSDVELRVDHAALFVGPFRLKAPPYGSLYLEASGTLLGDTTLAAAACYAAAGLTLTLHEPADHIAVELEFMAYLTARTASAERPREFLRAHVGAWAPAFCAAIERGAETRFYRCLADVLRAFIEAEVQRAGGNGFAVSSCGTWQATQ